MSCSVNEAKARITPQEFRDWLAFFKENLTYREHLNMCQANVAYTIAAVNKGKGQRQIPFNKFVLDYKEASKTDEEKTIEKIHKFFGGKVNGKK